MNSDIVSARRKIGSEDDMEDKERLESGDMIPTVFSWKHGGKNIYLSGTSIVFFYTFVPVHSDCLLTFELALDMFPSL